MIVFSFETGTHECVSRAENGVSCILLGGPSGAGKSTVSALLASNLDCSVLALDDFYRDKTDVPLEQTKGGLRPQWDRPEAVDWELALGCIQAVIVHNCTSIKVPKYSFEADARVSMKDVAIPSSRYLIIDGTLAHILLPACVELGISTITVYVHADLTERVRRIAERNRANPRRQVESEVAAAARVSAMAKGEARWVLPQIEKAGIVIQSDIKT